MKQNIFIAIIVALVFSACQQPTPTYNKDYSNEKFLIRDFFVKNEYQANNLITQLNNSNNKLKTFINMQQTYSIPVNGKPANFVRYYWTDTLNMIPQFGNKIFALEEGQYLQEALHGSWGYQLVYLEKKVTKQQFRQSQADYNKKELERIASYEINYLKEHDKLLKELPKHLETYIQPYNKKESCKIWMGYPEGNTYFEEDSYKIAWDGKCKNGFASGLGREIESADMMDKWGIAIYKKGKPTYYMTKDNLSDVLFEGIHDARNNGWVGVYTTIKEKNDDIDIRVIAGVYDGKNHILIFNMYIKITHKMICNK